MANEAMGEADSWCTVESDPGVFHSICEQMGIKGIQFEEIFTLGPEAFLDLGDTVHGLIFLFKWRHEKREELAVQDADDQGLFFASQVIPNACATQAILSILLNSQADIGPHLTAFKEFTSGMDPQMRGLCLSNSEAIRSAHNSFRVHVDNYQNDKDDKDKEDPFHFVAYIRCKGKLFELDGLKPGPLLLGEVADQGNAWLDLVRTEIQKRIDIYQAPATEATGEGEQEKKVELRFNLMAIVADKLQKAEKQLEWQRFLRQRSHISLLSRGEEIELEDEMEEDDAPADVPSFEELCEKEIPELKALVVKCNGEIFRLKGIVTSEKELRETWKKENEKRKQDAINHANKMAQMQAMEQMQMFQSVQSSTQGQGAPASGAGQAAPGDAAAAAAALAALIPPASAGGASQAAQGAAAAAPAAPAAPAPAASGSSADSSKQTGGAPKTAGASESENTDKMRQHQMMKTKVVQNAMKHEDVDIFNCSDLVDKSARTSGLNVLDGYGTLFEIMGPNTDGKALISDVDPQLLIKVNFKEKVNVTSISFKFGTPPELKEEDADQPVAKPRLIKCFTNMDELDFGDAEEMTASAQWTLADASATEAKIVCVGHKFQRLQSLQVFIDEANDEDALRTFINQITLTGHQAASYHAEYK